MYAKNKGWEREQVSKSPVTFVLKSYVMGDFMRGLFAYLQRPDSRLRISLASLSPASFMIRRTKSKGLDTGRTFFRLRMPQHS